MIKTNQPWRDDREESSVETYIEIHVEQVQAIVQNLNLREGCASIAAVFISNKGYLLGSFPSHTTEEQFCQSVWEYCLEHDIDKFFISYPTDSFMIDAENFEPADYLTLLEMNTDLRLNNVVLAYYTYDDASYSSKHVWASKANGDLVIWDRYDPKTLRKINENQC
jgi:hypothetical protein